MRRALVSVIMPVHNAGKFVREAIQSVLNQSYSNWELLIINDGSSDDSVEQIGQLRDDRIIFLNRAHRGVSAARNVGLAHMRGEYFCFLDADDVLPPRSLEARLGAFSETVAFVDGAVDIFDHGMKYEQGQWAPTAEGDVLSKLFRLSDRCFFGLTWMVRRQPHVRYEFNESLGHCEDVLFFMTIADSGKYTFTRETILRYRRNPASAMHNLKGLANGYSALRYCIRETFPQKLSFFDKCAFDYKVRRIMCLTFLRRFEYKSASRYLLYGRL